MVKFETVLKCAQVFVRSPRMSSPEPVPTYSPPYSPTSPPKRLFIEYPVEIFVEDFDQQDLLPTILYYDTAVGHESSDTESELEVLSVSSWDSEQSDSTESTVSTKYSDLRELEPWYIQDRIETRKILEELRANNPRLFYRHYSDSDPVFTYVEPIKRKAEPEFIPLYKSPERKKPRHKYYNN